MATGVSPRKRSLTVYIMTGFQRHEALMGKLGRYTTGKSCLYIKKLEDIDIDVLRDLVRESFERVSKGQYGWLTRSQPGVRAVERSRFLVRPGWAAIGAAGRRLSGQAFLARRVHSTPASRGPRHNRRGRTRHRNRR